MTKILRSNKIVDIEEVGISSEYSLSGTMWLIDGQPSMFVQVNSPPPTYDSYYNFIELASGNRWFNDFETEESALEYLTTHKSGSKRIRKITLIDETVDL